MTGLETRVHTLCAPRHATTGAVGHCWWRGVQGGNAKFGSWLDARLARCVVLTDCWCSPLVEGAKRQSWTAQRGPVRQRAEDQTHGGRPAPLGWVYAKSAAPGWAFLWGGRGQQVLLWAGSAHMVGKESVAAVAFAGLISLRPC